jgi:broad specificity phosphatase PhoE
LGSGKFDIIISSPLSRAKHTAELIAKEVGYTGQIILMEELQELDFGLTAVGKKEDEMRKDHFYDEYYKLSDEKKALDKVKRREMTFDENPAIYLEKYKIETTASVVNRMNHVKNYILQHGYKKIIIVTHGGTIDWMHRVWLNVYDYFGSNKNCSIALYKVEKCVFKLIMASDEEHL